MSVSIGVPKRELDIGERSKGGKARGELGDQSLMPNPSKDFELSLLRLKILRVFQKGWPEINDVENYINSKIHLATAILVIGEMTVRFTMLKGMRVEQIFKDLRDGLEDYKGHTFS